MSDINALYQKMILDHNKSPRNYGDLDHATNQAEGYNPLCGDHFWVELQLVEDKIENLKFHGQGCAISTASASIMTELLQGKSLDEAKALFKQFHDLVTLEATKQTLKNLPPKLEIFAGVRDFPTRVKCASLAWHTLMAGLDGNDQAVYTE